MNTDEFIYSKNIRFISKGFPWGKRPQVNLNKDSMRVKSLYQRRNFGKNETYSI